MRDLRLFTRYYFLLLLFSPVISYLSLTGFNISSQYYMGVIVTMFGIGFLILSKNRLKIPGYAWILFLYIIYTFVWSFLTGEIAERGYRVILKNQLIHTFFAIIVIQNSYFTDKFRNNVIRIIKITVIFAALASIAQIFVFSFMDANPIWARGEVGDTLFGDRYNDRRPSIFGFIDPNELGLSYMPLLSVLIGLMLYKKYRYYYVFLVLGGVSALLSNTRYVMVAFIILSIQIVLFQKNRIYGVVKYALISLVIGFVLLRLLNIFGYNVEDWIASRLFVEGSIEESTRYKAFINFAIFFPQKPWFGFGEMTAEIRHASAQMGSSQIHVGYLSHLIYYGIIGSILLFTFWFKLTKQLYKNAKLSGYWGSFFAFLIFLFANATLVTFHIFFYGIIIALVFDKYFSDKVIYKKEGSLLK